MTASERIRQAREEREMSKLYGTLVVDDSGVLAAWQRFGLSREDVVRHTLAAAEHEFPTATNLRVYADSHGATFSCTRCRRPWRNCKCWLEDASTGVGRKEQQK